MAVITIYRSSVFFNRVFTSVGRSTEYPLVVILDEFQYFGSDAASLFDYWYAARTASFRSLRDRALAYGIYGGTPHYLSTLHTGVRANEIPCLQSPTDSPARAVKTCP
jgi:hypothetical protein